MIDGARKASRFLDQRPGANESQLFGKFRQVPLCCRTLARFEDTQLKDAVKARAGSNVDIASSDQSSRAEESRVVAAPLAQCST
jgi:hypothetical protein